MRACGPRFRLCAIPIKKIFEVVGKVAQPKPRRAGCQSGGIAEIAVDGSNSVFGIGTFDSITASLCSLDTHNPADGNNGQQETASALDHAVIVEVWPTVIQTGDTTGQVAG